jgi:hypothetical protein
MSATTEPADHRRKLGDAEVAGSTTRCFWLDEEENLERLRRWYRAIRGRDLFDAPGTAPPEQRLKDAAKALDRLAGQVYQASEHGGAG